MPEGSQNVLEHSPVAFDPAWRRFRDAFYRLVITRADQKGDPAFGDAADRRLVDRLATLVPTPRTEAYLLAGVEEVAHDLGRHVYAKRVLEDNLDVALATLARDLEASGIGTLETVDRFHRSAGLRFHPFPGFQAAPPPLQEAYLVGLLCGALGEAFNCSVAVTVRDDDEMEIALGAGRDVNKEGPTLGESTTTA